MGQPARRRETPKRWPLSRHWGMCAGARSAARPKQEGGGGGERAQGVRGRERDPSAWRPGTPATPPRAGRRPARRPRPRRAPGRALSLFPFLGGRRGAA